MKYSVAKYNAQLFANERSITVYIAKADKKEDYCLCFDKKTTPHFTIIEAVNKCITFNEDKENKE